MSVHLTPSSSLGFKRPLTQTVKRILTVTNNNELPVAFKVKTTAVKLYCVRPNMGRVEPGESAEVQVLLQAMENEPPQNKKCRDKFLFQSAFITPGNESLSSRDFWTSLETNIYQQKLKVVYLPTSGDPADEEDDGVRNSMLSQSDPTTQYSTTISITIDLLKQGDSLRASVRSVHNQPSTQAAESVFLPMPVTQPTGDRPISSKPVATIAPRRSIWTYLKRLMRPHSKGRKDKFKRTEASPITPISAIDQKVPPPPYFPVLREHSHDEKPPHQLPFVQENAPMFLRVPFPIAQRAQEEQQHPFQSEVEREPQEQLAQEQGDIERWRMSVACADAPAARRRKRSLSTIISEGQAEVEMLVDSAVIRPQVSTPMVMAMFALLVFITTYLDF
ncbi:PapD-like protein [Rickenella mellea]|uniref:PapD-like protein n=1 Tax=Rickenella mellea TaxID=50990 RepID=A0A4Y7Q7I7_9AGAM|nr:PapD-like protein [Rickenella mellea]